MNRRWPSGLAGIVIALVALMLGLVGQWVPALLMFILALTIVFLPIRRRGIGKGVGIMRLCPRNVAAGLAVLGLLLLLVGLPTLGIPFMLAGIAVYYFWPRRGPGRRR